LRRIEDDSIIKKVGVRLEKNFKDLDDKIGAVLMFVVLVITFLNVVSRYLIHASFSFTEELTSVIFVLISLLGASIATKNVGHFALDLLTNYMPPKAKAICKVLSGFDFADIVRGYRRSFNKNGYTSIRYRFHFHEYAHPAVDIRADRSGGYVFYDV